MNSQNNAAGDNKEEIRNNATMNAPSENPSAQPGMRAGFLILGAAYIIGVIMQNGVIRTTASLGGSTRHLSVIFGLSVFIIVLAVGFKVKWHRFLTSNRFAVPALACVTAFSIIGTLIVQTKSTAVGASNQGWISLLFLNDIFHSFGFSAVVGMGAGGIALVLARKRRFTMRYAGSVGAHLGLLFILAGASVGILQGVKGRLDLHIGESSDRFSVEGENGLIRERPLGFSVTLDDFRVLHYDRDLELLVYDISREREKKLAAVNPASENDVLKLRAYGVETVRYFPDHAQEWEVTEDSGDSRTAALGLLSQQQEGIIWMFDDRSGNFQADAPRDVKFFWEAARAEKFLQDNRNAGVSSPHILSIGGKEIAVEPGGTYSIPGTDQRLEVTRALADFVLDETSKKPTNRSDKPNNPAIEVLIKDAKDVALGTGWLFANYPDFHGMKNELSRLKITYHYRTPESISSLRALIVGEREELWKLANGEVLSRIKMEKGRPLPDPFEKLTLQALYPTVRRSLRDVNRSNKTNNPLAVVRLAGHAQSLSVTPREPLRLSESKVLVLAPKGGDTVRDYVSLLTVAAEGHKVLSATVEVNHPLSYRGYSFFQSDYRPDDPTFSGFQVVRDPGLWIVYLGLILNASGVICALLAAPLLKRKKAATGAVGGGA